MAQSTLRTPPELINASNSNAQYFEQLHQQLATLQAQATTIVTAFTGLSDTFAYSGNSGRSVRVNAAEKALEAFDLPATQTVGVQIYMFYPGGLAGSQVFGHYVCVEGFTLPINCTGSQAHCKTASSGSDVFSVTQNGSSIGTITFPTSQTGTFAFAAATTFVAGDVLEVVAPVGSDATGLFSVGIVFLGTRT